MKQLSEVELEELLMHKKHGFGVFLYTPMCGTCKLAEKMLSVLSEMIPSPMLYKSNVNTLNRFMQSWKIQSIPCLIIMDKGECLRIEYKMGSIDRLYDVLQPIWPPSGFGRNGSGHNCPMIGNTRLEP